MPLDLLDPSNMLAIADMLPVMINFVDESHVVRFLNTPLAEWMGEPRERYLGRHVREMVGEQAYAERRPLMDAALAGQKQWFISDFNHPTRGPLALQLEYLPWVGPEAKIRGVIVLLTDVTEQRATERALRESEARFRRIANSAPALMWVTRADRVRDFVNDAYAEFVGLKGEAARLFDWRDAIHSDDRDRVMRESLAGEASGKPFTLEARYRRADGEYRWLRSVSSPRYDADGRLMGFIGVASDITLSKHAEDQLKAQVEERTAKLAASEARFRSIFDTVQEVLVLLDPKGNVVEMNRKKAPWRADDLRRSVGRKVWESATLKAYPQHIPMIRDAVRRAARGKTFMAEVPMERPGVPTTYLDLSVQPVRGDDGTVIYLLLEARDVTDLKAAQEQLRQSQKMEALGQLTGGIAHDFNNLLTVVVGGLDIICKRSSDDKVKRYAENALAAAERGARLTGQLLAFSRVQRLEVKPTPVTPLIEDMRPLLRNVLGPGIEKRFELDAEGMWVMADPTQLEVALLNLAINARDAMADGGILTFRSRSVRVRRDSELEPGDYVELSIADTGSGMTEEVIARAFEPFFTTKEVGKGTGLGLSMVYGMARQSGGTARIESRAGEGTTVKLLFRVAQSGDQQMDAGEPIADHLTHRSRPASILVIDDDPDVRQFVVTSLEEEGFDVRDASDGFEGLRLFSQEAADLVVLDFVMPSMSGAEVASRIRVQRPEQAILFVSGYNETDAVRRVAPDAPLLAKPFRAGALVKAVRSALIDG
ncbi:PAS domain-containing protein [Sphingomonas piscis]|uniref:histidine kinase n=1 Tax=Sphingomonas piscis TaxID=2714943 RepID=A0A6G7YPT9_9SPHN|nr:PAS domain-containing protein [Sphingomonas piscis]QIK78754.1 PAS domain-containing protein [Sphingomonas piscis]